MLLDSQEDKLTNSAPVDLSEICGCTFVLFIKVDKVCKMPYLRDSIQPSDMSMLNSCKVSMRCC